jgi:hypothetical protein
MANPWHRVMLAVLRGELAGLRLHAFPERRFPGEGFFGGVFAQFSSDIHLHQTPESLLHQLAMISTTLTA